MTYQLSKKRYEEIDEELCNLFEDTGFTEYPVDPQEMAERLKIEVKFYSEIPDADKDFVVSKFNDGYGVLILKRKFVIYLSDKMPKERIRFTLWYEIAHIQLGHYDEDCKKSQAEMKREANHFASSAIAEMPFVARLEPKNFLQVAEKFSISYECADNIYQKYLRITYWPSVKKKVLSNRITRIMKFNVEEDYDKGKS